MRALSGVPLDEAARGLFIARDNAIYNVLPDQD
jgi:hypothetical protein